MALRSHRWLFHVWKQAFLTAVLKWGRIDLPDFPAGAPSASGQSDSPIVSPLPAETMTLCIPFLEAMPVILKDQASLPNDEVAAVIVD